MTQKEMDRRMTYLEARFHVCSPTALLRKRPLNEEATVFAAIADNKKDAQIVGKGFVVVDGGNHV